MSKLSQETIDRLKKEAIQADVKNMNQSYQYRAGYRDGHLSGATEWAGRAQGLVEVLEDIKAYTIHCLKHLTTPNHDVLIKKVDEELAKYKEVGNG